MKKLNDLVKKMLPQRMLVDNEMKSAMNTVSGELQTAQRADKVSINFQYGPVGYNVNKVIEGGGIIDRYKALARVGIDGNISSATLISKDSVRYTSGHECLGAISHIFAEPEENVNQYAGILNEVDGLAFGYKGLDFGVWYIEGGNQNFIKQSDFNANKLDSKGYHAPLINPQRLNIYKISYAWHGGLPIYFSVFTGWQTGWQLVHVIDEVNTSTETHLENPSIPVSAKIERTSGTGNPMDMYCGSWRAGSLVSPSTIVAADRFFSYRIVEQDISSNTDTAVLLIRNKQVYQGKINHVKVTPLFVTFITSGAQDVLFAGVKDPTIIGTPNWIDTDTENSVCEFATGSFEVTSGISNSAPISVLGKTDKGTIDAERFGFVIYPGELLAVVARSSANSTITTAMTVKEEF